MWGILFTAIWSGLKAFFGKSDQEKLGIAEITVKQQAETINIVEKANAVDRVNAGLSDSRLRVLTKQWERADS